MRKWIFILLLISCTQDEDMRLFATNLSSTPVTPTTTDVKVVVMIGASDMNGSGSNFDGLVPHDALDFASISETDANPNIQIWNPIAMGTAPLGWQDLTFSKSLGNAHNNNYVVMGDAIEEYTTAHGRELQISNRLAEISNVVNLTNNEKLYIIKYGKSGDTYPKLLKGTNSTITMWNTYVVPAINNLITAGKTPSIYVMVDSISDIFATAYTYKDLDAYIWTLKSLFGNDVPISISAVGTATLHYPAENTYTQAFAVTNSYDVCDETGFPEIALNDGHHSYLGIEDMADVQLPQINSATFKEITSPLSLISTTAKEQLYFRGGGQFSDITPSSTTLNIITDVPFNIEVFTDVASAKTLNTMNYSLDVSGFTTGIAIFDEPLTGVTDFRCANIGISYLFNMFWNNYLTLNYLDIRGSNFGTFITMDIIVQRLALATTSNGTLMISGSKNSLTTSAQADYDTLTARGWTIDVARP